MSGSLPEPERSRSTATGSGGRVYLEVLVLDVPRDTQVAGTLYRVDSDGRLTFDRSISIPKTNDDYGSLMLSLDAGTYAVEAVLPSGQRISEVFELQDDQDLPIVLRFNLPSPHEWMRWETYAGLVDERRYHESAGGIDLAGHPSFQVTWGDDDRFLDWDTLDTMISNRVSIPSARPSVPITDIGSVNEDRLAQKFIAPGITGVCTARAGAAVTLQPIITSGQYQVLMYGAPADRSIRAWTTVMDNPIIASALAYKARGATDAAKAILWERRSSLGTGLGAERDCCAILYTYLDDLHTRDRLWFDARSWLEHERVSSRLADVHILSAWHRLLGAMTTEDVWLVRQDLDRAYSCGLPAFSQGVRLLRDGLAMSFVSHPADRRSDIVRRVARRVDFTQPFTSLRLSSAATRLDDPSGGPA